jgi:amino acid adenylation domain-containing protein
MMGRRMHYFAQRILREKMRGLEPDRQDALRTLREADETLTTCFERVVAIHGLRTALVSDRWQPTYAELNRTANRLAHAIVARGGAPGDRVAILMEHDAPAVTAVVAVLKAANVVVALNPSHPAERLRQIVEDSEPNIIVTDLANRQLAADIAGPRRAILNFEDGSAEGSDLNLSIVIPPDQTAVLGYTSGSTGRPKAVMMTHDKFRRNSTIHTEAMSYTAEDRLPLFGSLSNGQGISNICCALLNGAALCPFPVVVRGVTGLADWIECHRLTVYSSSASIFRNFITTLREGLIFHRVRAVRLSSESATSNDFQMFQKHFPDDCVFVHTLSSSETGNIAWSCRAKYDNVPEGRLPVGLPSRGHEVLLLDANARPVRPGEIGEIVVRSRYLSKGYWRDPELTARRFSGELDDRGTRLVHTGDLGRINSDGLLEFYGRRDDQVKIRGNRIEIGEIEQALHKLHGIKRAMVEVIARPAHEPVLVGFVTLHGSYAWSATKLRRALRAALPDAMVPSEFVILDAFPLTPTGKIDREKLRQDHRPARDPTKTPQLKTESERLLAGLWADIFELSDIDRDDDFFALGGDSLLAAVVGARVHEAVNVTLDLGMFADHSTLAGLARVLDELRTAGADGSAAITPVPHDKPLPLSLFQERIWNFCQRTETAAGYVFTRSHRVLGPLDGDLLRDCINDLARRHECFRTTFHLLEGRPVQIIHAVAPDHLSFLDLSGSDNPEQEADRIFKTEARATIDLDQLPIVRFKLVRIRHDEHWLFRVGHHLIADGSSWNRYFRELALLYEAKLIGNEPALSDPMPLQYADYAVWQRKALAADGSLFREVTNWWRDILARPRRIGDLPFRRAEPPADVDPAQGTIPWQLEPNLVRRLDELARGAKVTDFVVRLAAFSALLADETGERDVVIGTYFVNRSRWATQDMLGLLTNLALLVFEIDSEMTFRTLLSVVMDTVFKTERRSEIPHEKLCEHLQTTGVRAPEVRVIFSMASDHSDVHFSNITLRRRPPEVARMPWGFTFYMDERIPDNCSAVFDASLYDPAGVRRFIARYRRLADAASQQPDLRLGELLAMSRNI